MFRQLKNVWLYCYFLKLIKKIIPIKDQNNTFLVSSSVAIKRFILKFETKALR